MKKIHTFFTLHIDENAKKCYNIYKVVRKGYERHFVLTKEYGL